MSNSSLNKSAASTTTTASPVDAGSASSFSRISIDLEQAAKTKAESSIFSSIRATSQRGEGMEQEFDSALKLLIKTLPEPYELDSIASKVGKTDVFVRNLRLTGMSTLRRHGEVMFSDEDEFHMRKTATHLFVGPVKMTFKLFYGTRKRRMEVTASGLVFGIRIKADKRRQEMKLDKFTLEAYDLKLKFIGDKKYDPIANIFLLAIRPVVKIKVRQVLEHRLAEEVTKHQDKTSLKMIRMLYAIKEKPWSGLEGRLSAFGSRKSK